MHYEGNIIRPPSEAHSILLQITVGCSHNKCTFCGAYKGERFKIKHDDIIMKDIAFRSFPLSHKEVLGMIGQIRSYPLLLGIRGEKRKDINAIADTIVRVGTILKKFPDISDIEVNPLAVYDHGSGVKAVDVRILLTNLKEAG